MKNYLSDYERILDDPEYALFDESDKKILSSYYEPRIRLERQKEILNDPEFYKLPKEDQAILREKYALDEVQPETNIIGGAKDVGKMLYDIPVQTKGAIGALMEDKYIDERDTTADKWRREAKERTGQRNKELSILERQESVLPFKLPFMDENITRGDVADASQSTGFSGVAMGSGLLGAGAGAIAGAGTGGLPAVATIPTGAMAGSGAAAYKMAKVQIVEKLLEHFEAAKKEPLTLQEQRDIIDANESDIFKYAAWEAGPEAISQTFGVIPGIKNIVKGLSKNAFSRLAKGVAGVYGTELATETTTGMGQQPAESRMGLTDEPERQWSDPADISKTFQEVAPGTVVLSSVLGGGAALAGGAGRVVTKTPTDILKAGSVDEAIETFNESVNIGILGGMDANAKKQVVELDAKIDEIQQQGKEKIDSAYYTQPYSTVPLPESKPVASKPLRPLTNEELRARAGALSDRIKQGHVDDMDMMHTGELRGNAIPFEPLPEQQESPIQKQQSIKSITQVANENPHRQAMEEAKKLGGISTESAKQMFSPDTIKELGKVGLFTKNGQGIDDIAGQLGYESSNDLVDAWRRTSLKNDDVARLKQEAQDQWDMAEEAQRIAPVIEQSPEDFEILKNGLVSGEYVLTDEEIESAKALSAGQKGELLGINNRKDKDEQKAKEQQAGQEAAEVEEVGEKIPDTAAKQPEPVRVEPESGKTGEIDDFSMLPSAVQRRLKKAPAETKTWAKEIKKIKDADNGKFDKIESENWGESRPSLIMDQISSTDGFIKQANGRMLKGGKAARSVSMIELMNATANAISWKRFVGQDRVARPDKWAKYDADQASMKDIKIGDTVATSSGHNAIVAKKHKKNWDIVLSDMFDGNIKSYHLGMAGVSRVNPVSLSMPDQPRIDVEPNQKQETSSNRVKTGSKEGGKPNLVEVEQKATPEEIDDYLGSKPVKTKTVHVNDRLQTPRQKAIQSRSNFKANYKSGDLTTAAKNLTDSKNRREIIKKLQSIFGRPSRKNPDVPARKEDAKMFDIAMDYQADIEHAANNRDWKEVRILLNEVQNEERGIKPSTDTAKGGDVQSKPEVQKEQTFEEWAEGKPLVTRKNGKPFKTRGGAKAAIKRLGMEEYHVIKSKGADGFVGAPIGVKFSKAHTTKVNYSKKSKSLRPKSNLPAKQQSNILQELTQKLGKGIKRLIRTGKVEIVSAGRAGDILSRLGVEPKFSQQNVDKLRKQIKKLQPKVDDAYQRGDLKAAEDYDAALESAYDNLDDLLFGLDEGDGTIGVGLTEDDEQWSVEQDLASAYRQLFITDTLSSYVTKVGDPLHEKVEILRGIVNDSGFRLGGVKESITDEQIVAAAKDAYEVGRKRISAYSNEPNLTNITYSKDGKTIEAFTIDGKVYLVDGNIKRGEALSVLLHEFGHLYLPKAFTGKQWNSIVKAFNRHASKDTETGEAVRTARNRVPDGTNKEHRQEEEIAYYLTSEANKDQTLYRRIVAYIKRALTKLGIPASILTPDDVVVLTKGYLNKQMKSDVKDNLTTGGVQPAMSATGPEWYSRLQKTITEKGPKKAPAKQWISTLASWKKKGTLPGPVQEELEWSGLENWLKLNEDKVSKADVVQYLKDNGVEVGEVVKGEVGPTMTLEAAAEQVFNEQFNSASGYYDDWMYEAIEEEKGAAWDNPDHKIWSSLEWTKDEYMADEDGDAEDAFIAFDEDVDQLDWDVDIFSDEEMRYFRSEAQSQFMQDATTDDPNIQSIIDDNGGESATKFGKHQLPGGENYKELYITLPMLEGRAFRVPSGHESGSETADTQQVARIRMNEREDIDGNKVLFVEEVQSDIVQKGRKMGGFAGTYTPDTSKWVVYPKKDEYGKIFSYTIKDENGRYVFVTDEAKSKKEAIEIAVRETRKILDRNLPPNIPFKTAWQDLALKKVTRYAAMNGFDKVAWISGAQTADRYDLSKEIDHIGYEKNNDGTYQVSAFDKNLDQPIWSDNSATLKTIENHVGKEIAQKIKDGQGVKKEGMLTELREDDLKLSASWASALYDKSLPTKANRLIKKFGGKVEELIVPRPPMIPLDMEQELSFDEDGEYILSPQLGFTITPELKASAIGQGMPLFSKTNPDIRYSVADTFTGAKTKVEALAEKHGMGELFSDIAAALWDRHRPLKKIQARSNTKLKETEDVLLHERVLPDRISAEIKEFRDGELNTLFETIVNGDLELADIEELGYVQHVPEANLAMKRKRAHGFIKKIIKDMTEKEGRELENKMIDIKSNAIHGDELNRKEMWDGYIDLMDSFAADIPTWRQELSQRQAELDAREWTNAELAKGTNERLYKQLQNARDRFARREETILGDAAGWESVKDRLAGITNNEARKIERKWRKDKRFDAAQEAVNQLRAINQKALDINYEAGELSQEAYEAIDNAYDLHLPLHREDRDFNNMKKAVGNSFGPLGSPVKLRGGSTRKVVDIFAHVIDARTAAISRKHKLEGSKIMYDMINNHPEMGWVIKEQPDKVAGNDNDGNIEYYSNIQPASNEFPIKVDGKQYIVTTPHDDKVSQRFIKALDRSLADTTILLKGLRKVNMVLAQLNTGKNPVFMFTNFFRDIETAMVTLEDTEGASGAQTAVLKNVSSAINTIWRAERGNGGGALEESLKSFTKTGAKISWIQGYEGIDDLAKSLESDFDRVRNPSSIKNRAKKTLDFFDAANTAVENGVRLATYDYLINTVKLTEKEAARLVKDLTVDFRRGGTWKPTMNALYLFSSAGIVGQARVMKALIRSSRVRKIAGGIFTLGGMSAMLGPMMGGYDDDGESFYDKLKRTRPSLFERNMVFMKPGGKGDFWRFPLAYGFGVIYQGGGEAVSALRNPPNYNAMQGAMSVMTGLMNTFNPIASSTLLQTMSPTIVDPIVQNVENKNWFGGDLMPEKNPFGLEKPDSERYWKEVSPISKGISKRINALTGGDTIKPGLVSVSPESIDNTIAHFTGGLGRLVMDTTMFPFQFASGDKTIGQAPLIRKFTGKASDYVDAGIYKQNRKKVDIASRQFDAADTFKQKARIRKKPEHKMVAFTKTTEKTLRKLRKRLRLAEDQGNKATIKKIKQQIRVIHRRYNKRYNRVMEQ